MKLLFPLGEAAQAALSLEAGEEIRYCVPTDLTFDVKERQALAAYALDTMLVVTTRRLVVLQCGERQAEYFLADCDKIKCEHQVYSGVLTVFTADGRCECVARFSMRQIVRVSYVARGAQSMIDALKRGESAQSAEWVVSKEYEKYCEKCGRTLPGTSKCPYCEGHGDVLKKFMALCGEFIGKFLLISLLMVVVSGINLLTPAIQKHFIDNSLASGTGTVHDLLIFIGVTLALLLIRIGAEVIRYWNCVKLGASISMSIRRKLYQKIQALSMSYINSKKPGELMNRVSGDSRTVRNFMEEVFGDMFATLLTMIVSLVMMLIISWKMTLLSLVFVIFVFVIIRKFWNFTRTIFRRQWLKMDEVASSLQDVISGIRIVKSFGQEERESKKFREKANAFAAVQERNEKFWALFYPCLTFLLGVGTYIAVYFGGIRVLEGEMTVGELVQFVTYSGYLYGPLSWMTYLPRALMQLVTSLNRIYDIMGEEPALSDKEDSKEFAIKGTFDFENVAFGYQTYEPVLENINFHVDAGEMIGLVGASGTGKSTMINLIMRLYDVDQGKISIDGCDIKDIKMECLHSQIGVVLQETFLFSGSILANIRFAKQDATLEEVIRAAKAANAHDFICKTPDGYNTYVGEHGYNLSGGERQRIAIARAILNNPRILILDEATSALDTESEFLIQQALERLVKGRTTFAIAHRLSTLRNADRLIVIDKHNIAEIGTHNELLEKKGIYYGLVNAQLQMGNVKAKENE